MCDEEEAMPKESMHLMFKMLQNQEKQMNEILHNQKEIKVANLHTEMVTYIITDLIAVQDEQAALWKELKENQGERLREDLVPKNKARKKQVTRILTVSSILL